jgi:hypothetical protein
VLVSDRLVRQGQDASRSHDLALDRRFDRVEALKRAPLDGHGAKRTERQERNLTIIMKLGAIEQFGIDGPSMVHLISAGVTLVFAVGSCVFWLAWREARTLCETLFMYNVARNLGNRFQTDTDLNRNFPHLSAAMSTSLPDLRRRLVADVARKYQQTPKALEHALLTDTGATSVEEALLSPMDSSTVEDHLLAKLYETQEPFVLLVRRAVQQIQDFRRVQIIEHLLLAAMIILTVGSIAFMVLSVQSGAMAKMWSWITLVHRAR